MDEQPAVAYLVVLTGVEAGRHIPLTMGRRAVLGRSLDADLTFPDEPSLSRMHARIERDGDRYLVIDLGSANGTQVNGVTITEAVPLSAGDIVSCGALELRFQPPGTIVGPLPHTDAPAAEGEGAPRVRVHLASENRPGFATQELQSLPSTTESEAARASVTEGERAAPAPAPTPAEQTGEPHRGEQYPLPRVAELAAILRTVPLFARLTDGQIAALTRVMAERRYDAGVEIVRQGEEGLSLYLVLEGEVRVQRAGTGEGEVELASIGPGGFFGEMTLLDGLPRSATVVTVSPVRCALLPRWGLEDVIRGSPGVALEMLAVLSHRLRETSHMLTA